MSQTTEIMVKASRAEASAQVVGLLTSGMVGVQVSFDLDATWAGLRKTAVFRAGGKTYDRVNIGNSTTVPWEVLTEPNQYLKIGLYGAADDGSVVIPTIWAVAGQILPGADPSGDESLDPSLPVWQQLLTENEAQNERLDELEENGGGAEQDIESLLNPNNLITDPFFKNGMVDPWSTGSNAEIVPIEGKQFNGIKLPNNGTIVDVRYTLALWKMESGRYVFHCNVASDVAGHGINVLVRVINGPTIFDEKNVTSPYVEFELDKDAILAEYPNATAFQVYISYGWGGYGIVYEPYFGLYKYKNNGFYVSDYTTESNPLTGKIIAFAGDSICEGSANGGGYAKYIGEGNGMIVENRGRSGGTVAYSESEAAENPSWYRCISRDIVNMREDADYIILEGGVNDLYNEDITLGTLSNGYNAALDDTTFYGAFENMLKQALIRFPGKKIGYIAVHKMGNYFSAEVTENSAYHAAIACCAKWGIPVCDLNISCPPFAKLGENAETQFIRDTYTNNGDGWHPNAAGYLAYYVPKIEAWLKTL